MNRRLRQGFSLGELTLPDNYTHPELTQAEVDTIRQHCRGSGKDPYDVVAHYVRMRNAKGIKPQ